jgi:hypothetical protein
MRFCQVSLEAVELGEGLSAGGTGPDGPEANLLLALGDCSLRSAQLFPVFHYHFNLQQSQIFQFHFSSFNTFNKCNNLNPFLTARLGHRNHFKHS